MDSEFDEFSDMQSPSKVKFEFMYSEWLEAVMRRIEWNSHLEDKALVNCLRYVEDLIHERQLNSLAFNEKIIDKLFKFLDTTFIIYSSPPDAYDGTERLKYEVPTDLWRHRELASDRYDGFTKLSSFYPMMADYDKIVMIYNNSPEIQCKSLSKMILDMGIYTEAILFQHASLKRKYGLSEWLKSRGCLKNLKSSWLDDWFSKKADYRDYYLKTMMESTYNILDGDVIQIDILSLQISKAEMAGVVWPMGLKILLENVKRQGPVLDARHIMHRKEFL